MAIHEVFRAFAVRIAGWAGTAQAFLLALCVVLTWVLSGPHFRFSDTWQLVINTGTTVITFLMVFLIQNTQNRDTRETHMKLDELIRSSARARNAFIDLERLTDSELQRLANKLKGKMVV